MKQNSTAYYFDLLEIILLCTISFLIPVYVFYVPIFIVILSVLFFVRKRNYSALKNSTKNTAFWAMLFPFALYLLGLTYSEDISTALKNTETALSLLAFPFIATAFGQNKIENKVKIIKTVFITGVFVVMTFSIIRAGFTYIDTQKSDDFFYSSLINSPHHHSYYVLFSLMIIVEWISKLKWKENKSKVICGIFSAICMIVFIVMLSSKITILLLCGYLLYLTIKMLFSKKIRKIVSIPIFVCFLAVIPIMYFTPMLNYRFEAMITSLKSYKSGEETARTKTESTTIRLKCLKSAIEIIKDNYLFGTGQGDVYAEMEKEVHKYTDENYNGTCAPHNQFLRSFASFGILGIASMLLLFGVMIYKSIKLHNNLMILWTIISIIFFCIEDMFCIINGIVFFSLFTSIFFISKSETQN